MTNEEAREYAKTMTFRDAVYNLTQAKCIPYRKATLIKVYELLDLIEPKMRGLKEDTIIYDEFVGMGSEYFKLNEGRNHICVIEKKQ